MGLFVIAKIHRDNETIGYRLLDTESRKIRDAATDSVLTCLRKGVRIDNIGITDGNIKGTQGSLERYGYCNINYRGDKYQPLVILNKLKGGYQVADVNGVIKNVRDSDLIDYAIKIGLANGKVVNKDGNQFISAISGEYNEVGFTPSNIVYNDKRFVVLAFVHASNDETRCVSALYYDTLTNKKRSLRQMKDIRENDEDCFDACELYRDNNMRLQEVHDDVYDIHPSCIVSNRDKYGDDNWYSKEVVIGRVNANEDKDFMYLVADRIYGKARVVALEHILKELELDYTSYAVYIEKDGNNLVVKSATDRFYYNYAEIMKRVDEYSKNVENFVAKMDILEIDYLKIDASGKLIWFDISKVRAEGAIKIPTCVTEIGRGAIQSSTYGYAIKEMIFGPNITKVAASFLNCRLHIGIIRSDSLAVCNALANENTNVNIGELYCPEDIGNDKLARLYGKIRGKVYVGGSTWIDDARTASVINCIFSKKRIKDILRVEYRVVQYYYVKGIEPEKIIVDVDNVDKVKSSVRPNREVVGDTAMVQLHYEDTNNQHGNKKLASLVREVARIKDVSNNNELYEKAKSMQDSVKKAYRNRYSDFAGTVKVTKGGTIDLEGIVATLIKSGSSDVGRYRFTYTRCTDSIGGVFYAKTYLKCIGKATMKEYRGWMSWLKPIISEDRLTKIRQQQLEEGM